MRLIDADKLAEEIEYITFDNFQVYDDVKNAIERAPTLDYASVVHAHWILCVYGDGCVHAALCGHCGMLGRESNKYCPTCGAVMDLPEEYREER